MLFLVSDYCIRTINLGSFSWICSENVKLDSCLFPHNAVYMPVLISTDWLSYAVFNVFFSVIDRTGISGWTDSEYQNQIPGLLKLNEIRDFECLH